MISERFNSRTMQERIKRYLQGLRLDAFIAHGVGKNDDLTNLVSDIKTNYAKILQSRLCADNRLGISQNAVTEKTRARCTIDHLYVALKSFKEFYAA